MRGNSAIGSELIGQPFEDPRYFWGRPSATGPVPYNAAVSSGSNLGPTNPALTESMRRRVEAIRRAHPTQVGDVPVDLVTTSASGLDPDISPAAAEYQIARVAQARNMASERIRQLMSAHTQGRTFGLLGEPRVHVLQLNLALDAIESK
jgi:K+-transporting ATPase ATPase C chain